MADFERETKHHEKKRLFLSLLLPLLFLAACWILHLYSFLFDYQFTQLGVYPQKIFGLPGIVLSPFVHGDIQHLFANTFPFLILGSGIFYFYPRKAIAVFLSIWFFTGLGVWLFAREAYHIGASGLIYGFASFLFFSGVFSKNRASAVVSLLVVFLYGSMVWGILPGKPEVSWEAHLSGFICGLLATLWYLNKKESIAIPVHEKNLFETEFHNKNISYTYYTEIIYHFSEEDI
jgi:membrane associated rhomboid family serine protease